MPSPETQQQQGSSSQFPARDSGSSLENESANASTTTNKTAKESPAKPPPYCKVCGEGEAKMHYGILSFERNSCRSCRFQKCLQAGMDPGSVRPDRDFTGKHQTFRFPASAKKSQNSTDKVKQHVRIHRFTSLKHQQRGEDWLKKLPVEMRTMLMTLLNIETKVCCGDTLKDASEIYPLRINTIKELIDAPMRYEPYRMAKNEELAVIVYRRLIAAIDWVYLLSELMDGLSNDDRIALVKSVFAPLMLFKASAKTATVTDRENVLCLCNFAYVPRNIAKAYSDTYHLDNGLVDRLIEELVIPFRRMHLSDEEIACLSAIIVLNPMAKDLSESAVEKIHQLRNRIYDTLYYIVKESRPNASPASEFGNLLLFLPIITSCANAMNENLRFAQTFSSQGAIPLLTSLFGCFPVESLFDDEFMSSHMNLNTQSNSMDFDSYNSNVPEKPKMKIICKNVEVQTDRIVSKHTNPKCLDHFTSPVENESTRDFRLFRPPNYYTLTEMFDDRINNESVDYPQNPPVQTSTQTFQQQPSFFQLTSINQPTASNTIPQKFLFQNLYKQPLSFNNSWPNFTPNQTSNLLVPPIQQQQTEQQIFNFQQQNFQQQKQ